MTHILLIVENYNKSNFFWKRLSNKHRDIQTIINKYNGFEGNCIKDIADNNINADGINSTIVEYKNFLKKTRNTCRLLYISKEEEMVNDLKDSFLFLGYEYGFYKDNSNIYSSLFHEVIFGSIPELISFKQKLNAYSLFKNIEIAKEYLQTHKYLSDNGKDVEAEKEMFIYKIWKYL